jgi:adiponectin receptor
MYFFCFTAFVIFLMPSFERGQYRVLRGVVFVICGLCSAIPIFHIKYFTEDKYVREFITFPWAFGGGLYIFGACMYIMRIPERFKPGFFDIFGSSHQFFHFLIVAAAFVHYRASVQIFHERQLYTCPVPLLDAAFKQ